MRYGPPPALRTVLAACVAATFAASYLLGDTDVRVEQLLRDF